MFSARFNNAPLWIRGLIFTMGLTLPLALWIHLSIGNFYKDLSAQENEEKDLQHTLQKFQTASGTEAFEISHHSLVKKEDFANILENLWPKGSKKKLHTLSTGERISLISYLNAPVEQPKRGEKESVNKTTDTSQVSEGINTLLDIQEMSNPLLTAQEIRFEVKDDFLEIYQFLKKTNAYKNVFWREMNLDVKNPPNTSATFSIFTISKES